MTNTWNILKLQRLREQQENLSYAFQRRLHVTDDLVARLGLEAELEGHTGCVNCLEWNETGDLLASGSDDVQIILWDPFRHTKLHAIQSGHHGNIFSVKFLPNSGNGMIVSGAADCKIRVHDVAAKETTIACGCHAGRVKRLAVAPNVPFMFWSAAEDGIIMQFDMRTPHQCSNVSNNVLINLLNHMGRSAEAKCIAINPLRPELLAVGANDPYVRLYDRRMIKATTIKYPSDSAPRSSWERQNLIANFSETDEDNVPPESASYFVAGHLPLKQSDYRKRYRTLASTYVAFSPDGSELLVNLGGEQIYLFDIVKPHKPKTFDIQGLALITQPANGVCKDQCGLANGYTARNGTTNGLSAAGRAANGYSRDAKHHKIGQPSSKPLPPLVEEIKYRANDQFDKQRYTLAINLYNQAIQMCPEAPVLFGNRAAAFMKRGWDGDLYAALRDCHTALRLEPDYLKAHFRLARCLYELHWTKEALDCLQMFKAKYPEYAHGHAYEALDRDIKAAIYSRTENDGDEGGSKSDSQGSNSSGGSSGGGSTSTSPRHRKPSISEKEKMWRSKAYDYSLRFCGHCNTTTDIKEANFFGSKSQYIIAGSDDGSFFIWDRRTTNLARVLRGDDSIVNCLQPHHTYCMLATSGIDPVVRLWSPKPEDGKKEDREVVDSEDAAVANQKRMNADPLEVMLMNMGYRIPGVLDADDAEGQETPVVRCRPS